MSAYYQGKFYAVCADHWSSVWSAGVCRDVHGESVQSTSRVALDRSEYLTIVNSSVYNVTLLRLTIVCQSRAAVQLVCHDATCGLSSTTIQPYIVGGQIAAENAWPWAAVLLYRGYYQCTASLISSNWLLTAAHCFFSTGLYQAQPLSNVPQYFAVRLGSVLSVSYSRHVQVVSVRRIVLHPDYAVDSSTNMRYNDVALVQLGDDLVTPAASTTSSSNSRVTPVCLADSERHPLNTLKTWQCYVIGWGLSSPDGQREYESLVVICSAAIMAHYLTPNVIGD